MELTERVKRAREYEEQVYGELREAPIDLDALFDAVVKTVHYNYVGYEQKKQYFTPAEYHTYVFSHYRYRSLTVEMLVRSFHQFVGDMHDRHLRFHCNDWIDYRNLAARYRVRAYGDDLYVTEAEPDCGLRAGDRIVKVQGLTPERVRRLTRHNCFYSRERERELWGGYLRMAKSVTVAHSDGREETISIEPRLAADDERGEQERWPVTFSLLDGPEGRAACLRVERMDSDALARLIREHREEIESAQRLILDLRRCIGGEEGALWEIFPYLVSEEKRLGELIGDEGSYVLCTANNCDARLAQLGAFREMQEIPEMQGSGASVEEAALLEREIAFYRENRGKGLVFRPAQEAEEEIIRPAGHGPGRVILLTDTFCENEGEQFAAMCQRCGEKVMPVGRPTMGTLDYFDNIDLTVRDHMTLSYPISMTKAAYEGRGVSEKGLPVDVYIPWTPEELERDVLLEAALRA